MNILKDYDIIIITNIIPMPKVEMINSFCRKNNKGFIYTSQFGFISFLFEDFGNNFMVIDKNGKKCKKYFIKSISNACPGIVEIAPIDIVKNDKKKKKFLKMETGDYVIFKGVTGMTELNDSPPRPIRVLSKNKFTIEETSRYDEFMGRGIVEEYKIPFPVKFIPLSQAKKNLYFENSENNENIIDNNNKIIDEKIFDIEYDEMLDNEIKKQFENNDSWMNIFNISNKNETLNNISNSKIHLALLTLHEYFSKYNHLPKYNEEQSFNECISISSTILSKGKKGKEKWADDLNEIDNNYLMNIFKYCEFSFIHFTKFFGGIVAQETLKFIGLYKPAGQWIYFNFSDWINNNIPFSIDIKLLKDNNLKQDIEQYMNLDKEKIKTLKNTNITIIGFNDVGYELLNLFLRINICKNISIVDGNKKENYSEINKLKEIYDFKINIDNNIMNDISEKDWWKNSKIIIDTLSYKFNSREKELLIEKSYENNKILISVNANKSIGSFELIFPNEFRKKKNNINFLEDINTPKGAQKKIIKKNNEDDSKYKNILNLRESLDFSKEIFENYFYINIKYLNDLINRDKSESDMKQYIDELIKKENNNIKILKLIRNLKILLSLKVGKLFDSVVLASCELFQELFQFSIDEILSSYPEDYIELGKHKKFWSGKRYPPKPILFDINNETHFQLLYLIAYFLCQILDIGDYQKKLKNLKATAQKYQLKVYDISIPKRAKSEEYFDLEKNSLIQFLQMLGKTNKFVFKEIKLDINDSADINDFKKMSKHLQFIILTSNLILENYGILSNNNIYKDISLLFKINNILPSVSSSISGLLLFQLLLIFNDLDFIEFISNSEEKGNEIKEENNKLKEEKKFDCSLYKNFSVNLAQNIFLFYNNFKK